MLVFPKPVFEWQQNLCGHELQFRFETYPEPRLLVSGDVLKHRLQFSLADVGMLTAALDSVLKTLEQSGRRW